jgi:hypothetical protein
MVMSTNYVADKAQSIYLFICSLHVYIARHLDTGTKLHFYVVICYECHAHKLIVNKVIAQQKTCCK